MIKRTFSERLKLLLKHNPAVALLGPRQAGKTTLAKQVAKEYGNDAVYLDLESNRDLRKLDDAHTFLDGNKNKLVIIDEVQTLPHLFRELRPLIDALRKPERFLLLGSASPVLVKGVSETLAGRVAYLELTPFNLLEVTPKPVSQEIFWLRGGFPPSLLAEEIVISVNWRRSFLKSYIQTELSQLFHVDLTPVIIQNFWQMLAHFNGGIWNANTFAGSLGVTAPTVRRYLDYMEGAFLVRRLNPWFVNAKKRLVKSPKVYLRDSGILHALLNIDETNELYGHPGAGASWEGFVTEQIISMLPENIRPFYYRTHQGAEADLVFVKGIKPIASVEIKLTNAPAVSKGFFESIKDLKTKMNFVITPGSDSYVTSENIQVCSVKSFIEDYINEL
jgi:predicted AAA+ superfamily ATPase